MDAVDGAAMIALENISTYTFEPLDLLKNVLISRT